MRNQEKNFYSSDLIRFLHNTASSAIVVFHREDFLLLAKFIYCTVMQTHFGRRKGLGAFVELLGAAGAVCFVAVGDGTLFFGAVLPLDSVA
jgi:hypothetical protein